MSGRLFLTAIAAGLLLQIAAADDRPAVPMDPQGKAIAQWQQQLTGMFDADKDGKLSDQEKLMMQQAMQQHGWAMPMAPGGFPGSDQFVKQFDLDKDGKLSPQEQMMAQQMFMRMRGNGGMRGGVRGGYGGGASGGMQPQGMPMMPAGDMKGKGGKENPLVKRFDKDGDGKLNDEEKAAAQTALKNKDAKKDKAKK
jgi:hypothetical protein